MGLVGSDLSVYNTAEPYSNGDTSYITAAWGENDVYADGVPSQIVIGTGEVYVATVGSTTVNYRNVALRSNTQYHFFTRYDIRNELNASEVSPELMYCGIINVQCIQG